MTEEVKSELQGDVAVLTLQRPVANALAPSLRSELCTQLNQAIAADEVRAIVLCGAGHGFSSGVDIAEYDKPLAAPWVDALCLLIENSPKPVVVALHGAVLGAGFELALAAHGRVAALKTKVGLPEILLGQVPSGGATQRLPRLVGPQVALQMAVTGQPLDVSDRRLARVFDEIVRDDPVIVATGLARRMAAAGNWLRVCDRHQGFSDPQNYQKAVAEVAEKISEDASAEADIVRCIEAAPLLPFERGLAFEQAVFTDRMASPTALAQRHFFTAKRRATIAPKLAGTKTHQVHEIALVGGGNLLVELGVACLDAGFRVSLVPPNADHGAAIEARIKRVYDSAVSRQRFTAEIRDERLSRLRRGDTKHAMARADLILDRGTVLGVNLSDAKPNAVWALLSNDNGRVARDLSQGIEVRVYRPAHICNLVELAVSDTAKPDSVATLVQAFGRMGRTVVRGAGDRAQIGHQMSAALYRAALALVQSGASPYRVDSAARDVGFALGPFQMMDREGLEVVQARLGQNAQAGSGQPLPEQDSPLGERIAEGAVGRIKGVGFYRYDGKDAATEALVLSRYAEKDAQISDTDLGLALQAALVNQGARLLTEGQLQRASDLDVLMVMGYGFNARRGGPMIQADLRGAFSVLTDMKRFAQIQPEVWQPHPLIENMVKNGTGFFDRAADAAVVSPKGYQAPPSSSQLQTEKGPQS